MIDLASLRNGGFRVDGAARFDYSGGSVAGPGDLNGDGLADVVISAEQADHKGPESGSAYVVFGKRTTARIDLAKLGAGGLRLDGARPEDLTSWSVSGLGDMNGDGQPDLLVGAQAAASASGREHAGVAYVTFLPDIIVPDLKATMRAPQLLESGSILVTASCDEACTLSVSATVAGIALPRVSVQLRSAGRRTLRLTVPTEARARLTVLLGTGKQPSATVTVRAVDAAGNAAARRTAVRVGR